MKSKKNKSNQKKLSVKEENELLKLKMSAENGAQFFGKSNLPPDVEQQWLKNIMEFESQFEKAVRIRLFEKIGSPAFQKSEEMSDKKLTLELKRLFALLHKHNIALDVSGSYDDRVIYKFLTEELFECEVDDMKVEGMVNHFHYEEFHPNPLLDAQDALHEIFDGLSRKSQSNYIVWRFHESEFTDSKGKPASGKELEQRFDLLKEIFKFIELQSVEDEKVEMVPDECAIYMANLEYSFIYEGENKKQTFKERVEMELKPSAFAAMWGVTKFNLRGIEF